LLPDDHGASAQASGALSLGATLAARLERVGDVDWFRVDLATGVYAIDVQGASTQRGTLGDPMVSLYAADGSLLAQDDDSGAGFNALLEYAVLRPGSYFVTVSAPSTSPAGTAGTYAVRLSPAAETLVAGTDQADTAASSAANEWFEAGAGTDRWLLHGPRSHYAVTALAGGRWTLADSVPGRDGLDTLAGVERLVFTDRVLALDLQKNEPAGRASLLLGVALGPQALGNMALVGALVSYFDGGPSLGQAAQLLVDSGVLAQLAGGADNASFVRHIYQNAVGTPPSEATQAALAGYLDGGLLSQAEMFRIVAESPVHQQHIDLVGLQTRGLEYITL
ncbi:MAG: DVUA0089 family protein, partial [Burkholderiales bacterium]|nr:DVUA0089 family protein [Burkholderiales bacterium]